MKKTILISILFLTSINVFCQYRGTRQNGTLVTTEDYVTNSPGNSISNSKLIARYKDSTSFDLYYNNFRLAKYTTVKDDGVPTSVLWTDASGNVKKSPIPNWITLEADPQWLSEKDNYYTKTSSDARYLQGFTETDFTVPNYAKSLTGFSVIKLSTDPLYKPIDYLPSNSEVITALGYTPYNSSNPSGYISSIPAQSFASLTGKPTTLSGYGITDAYPLTGNPSSFLTSNQTITLSGDVSGSGTTSITTSLSNVGTSGTYGLVTTDSKGRVVSGKRTETYSGTTNASGVYTVTFSSSYSVAPNIQANIINGTDTQNIRTTSITTTGFTVLVRNRVDVVGLLPSWTNVNGASVDILISEK